MKIKNTNDEIINKQYDNTDLELKCLLICGAPLLGWNVEVIDQDKFKLRRKKRLFTAPANIELRELMSLLYDTT